MKTFKKVSASFDPVETYVTEDGFYKIIKRRGVYTLKHLSLFNILGETLGEFETLEDAIAAA